MSEPSTTVNPFSLDGEVVFVTGGGTGLGLGIARSVVAAGGRVVVTGRRAEPLRELVDEAGADAAAAVAGDVTDAGSRGEILAKANAAFGRPVTCLVNNAGQHLKKPAADVTDDEFAALIDTHVRAGFALARDAYPAMRDAGRGSIVFMGSMASYLGIPQVLPYTAAKCAVVGLTRALAAEWSGSGVRVNTVAPGWIDSPMSRKAFAGDPERHQKVIGRTPAGRLGEAADIGHAVVYLCSPAAAFVTGAVLPVDGGASIGF